MKKNDLLKEAFLARNYRFFAWIITAFTVTRDNGKVTRDYPYKVFSREWGYECLNAEMQLEKIDDAPAGEPLFTFTEEITIDPTWIPSLKGEPVVTTVGCLLANYFTLFEAFGERFPYHNKEFSIRDIEDNYIAPKLRDDPKPGEERNLGFFYCAEHVKFGNCIQDWKMLASITNWSATPKAITPPTGIEKFKASIMPKYEGRLTDPVAVSQLEGELKAFDTEYLKDDPAAKTLLQGKIKNNSRKKLFLVVGNETGFTDGLKANTVTRSLHEGWPTDPVQFSYMMNGSRSGSFARGAETVNGGVAAKYLLRAANGYAIEDGDCGTAFTHDVLIDEELVPTMVGRSVMEASKPPKRIENKEEAEKYLGKVARLRSPMYCKLGKQRLCRTCAGERLAMNPTGLTIPLTEISAIILAASLKKMHVSGTSTARLDITKVLS